MTQFKITATAPTSYQIGSLRLFGLNVKSYPTGIHVGEMIFDTEKEAKEYLTKRAEMYFDGNSENDEANLVSALEDIEKYGRLKMDAVSGSIEEVEIEEEEDNA